MLTILNASVGFLSWLVLTALWTLFSNSTVSDAWSPVRVVWPLAERLLPVITRTPTMPARAELTRIPNPRAARGRVPPIECLYHMWPTLGGYNSPTVILP